MTALLVMMTMMLFPESTNAFVVSSSPKSWVAFSRNGAFDGTVSTLTITKVHGRHMLLEPLYASSTSQKENNNNKNIDEDETTKKFGLEAGLFQSLQQKDGGESAKSLLKKYGIAYLATSIPLALVSFILCYILVDNGIDVPALLAKVGIVSAASLGAGDTADTVATQAGTLAIAYAAHKAASPLRFPPTVLLTPVVAKLIGKEPNNEDAA